MRRSLILLSCLGAVSPAWSAVLTMSAARYIDGAQPLIGQTLKIENCNLSSVGAAFAFCDVYVDTPPTKPAWSIRIDNASLAKPDLHKALSLCRSASRSERCWVNIVGIPALYGAQDGELPMMTKASLEWVGYKAPPVVPVAPSGFDKVRQGLTDALTGLGIR